MALLIDTSAVLGCVMNEPERDSLLRAAVGQTLLSAESLPFEVGNALTAMFKSRRINLAEAVKAVELYRLLPIELRKIDIEPAVTLSHQLGIYAYDGYMLQCALDTGAELLALDRGMKAAAKRAGIPVCEVSP